MESLKKCTNSFLAFLMISFLITACEKPTLKKVKLDEISEARPSKEEKKVSKGPIPTKKETVSILAEKIQLEKKVERVFAEKRTPEPGEGAVKPGAESVGNSRVLDIKYPVGRTLNNYQGKVKTEVNIIGREAETITVIRKSDKKRMTLPIANLSESDQTFISFLPARLPPPERKILPKPAYLVLRERELQGLRDKAKGMRRDIVKNGRKLIIVRAIKGRLKDLEEHIREVEQEIAFYKATHGIRQ